MDADAVATTGLIFGLFIFVIGVCCYARTIKKYLGDDYNGEHGVR